MRPVYTCNMSREGSVPEAIFKYLEASNFEDTERNALSAGVDAGTTACSAGAIAVACYKEIDPDLCTGVISKLPENPLNILQKFTDKYLQNINRHGALKNT